MEEIKATQTCPLLHANLISSLHPSAKNVFANGGKSSVQYLKVGFRSSPLIDRGEKFSFPHKQ